MYVDFLIAVNVIHHLHNEEIATRFTLNGYMREDEKNKITARYTIHPEAVLDPLHEKRLLVPEGESIYGMHINCVPQLAVTHLW